MKQTAPELYKFVNDNADNPETLRRAQALLDDLYEEEAKLQSDDVVESPRAGQGRQGRTIRPEDLPESPRAGQSRQTRITRPEDESESPRVGQNRQLKRQFETTEFDPSTLAYFESPRVDGDRKKVKRNARVEGLVSHTSENIATKARIHQPLNSSN